jgi:hypothetical protein
VSSVVTSKLIPPPWFDEALELKAKGMTVRGIAYALQGRGYKISHQQVWYWTTPQGFRRLKFIKRGR